MRRAPARNRGRTVVNGTDLRLLVVISVGDILEQLACGEGSMVEQRGGDLDGVYAESGYRDVDGDVPDL